MYLNLHVCVSEIESSKSENGELVYGVLHNKMKEIISIDIAAGFESRE